MSARRGPPLGGLCLWLRFSSAENNACACRLFNLRHGLRPARMFSERLLLYHHMIRSARRPHLAVSARHHTGIVPRDSARQDGLIGSA